MGSLRRLDAASTNEVITLSALTRVGRASDNDVVLDDACVSQFHASIAWTSPGIWELRDLGSSNGTFLDGVRLHAGDRRALSANSRVSFGVDAPQWEVVEIGRPFPEARDVASGERHLGTAHMLSLPVSAEESVDVFEESRGSWVIEVAGVVRDVRHGEVIDVDGRRYKVSLPLPIPVTEDVPGRASADPVESPLGATTFTFLVSSDRDSVELRVEWNGKRVTTHKAYVRALLALAEARQRDERAGGRSPHDQGWVYADELCTTASYESLNRLNVEVHRARAELAREGIPAAPAIVQRRRGTGQMRLGTNRVEIIHASPRS